MRSEGYSTWSVCLSVCLSTTILGLQATGRLMSDTNRFSAIYKDMKKSGDFAETTAFERYGVKTSENANIPNEHWLTSTRFMYPMYVYVSKSSAALLSMSKPTHDHAASL